MISRACGSPHRVRGLDRGALEMVFRARLQVEDTDHQYLRRHGGRRLHLHGHAEPPDESLLFFHGRHSGAARTLRTSSATACRTARSANLSCAMRRSGLPRVAGRRINAMLRAIGAPYTGSSYAARPPPNRSRARGTRSERMVAVCKASKRPRLAPQFWAAEQKGNTWKCYRRRSSDLYRRAADGAGQLPSHG